MNKVTLIGNLTRDPELRTTTSGVPVCSFSIAVNRRFKNANGQQETDFFNVSAWRQLGELCARYLSKGRKVCVIGSVSMRTYDAQDGTKRSTLEVQADEVEFLSAQQPGTGEARPAAPQAADTTGYAPVESGFTQVDDDELPF